MIDPTDSENDQSQKAETRYLEFIELLIDKSIKRLKSRSYRPKIQDALIAIRLKHKVFKDSESEKSFWNMIEELRQDELPKMYPESVPEPLDLESQIINTIKGLKYQVTNGTLAVQTITDYFNYHKSNESRLSYSRLGRILSAMGFRKTRISNGRSAIFWDDQLLSNGFGVQKLASASGSLSERSGNPAEGGASAEIIASPGMQEACQTDSTEGDATTSNNSSVSNICNSLSDNDLKEK